MSMSTPTAGKKLTPDVDDVRAAAPSERLLEDSWSARSRRPPRRELIAEGMAALLFLACAVPLAVTATGGHSSSPWLAALLVVLYAIVSRIEFPIGAGYVVPSYLVLVPMLVLLPVPYVPLFVLAGLLLGGLPDYLRGRVPLDRSLLRFVNSWHAIGPAIVLVAAGEPDPTLATLPIYVAALAAQFAFDFGSTALRDWIGRDVPPLSLLRFMVWIWAVDLALTPIALLAAVGSEDHPALLVAVLPLIALLAYFARERKARIDNALELSNAYRGTAFLLGDVVEADDAYTGLHSRDVVSLVTDVCDGLGVTGAERRDAEFAALLHDVGKIKIPSEIINKPGKLTDEEFELIKTHTVEGEKLLAQVGGILGNVGRIVRSCHEDWDGTGYPDGLVGDQIPRVARIVRCCDAYSAMTTDRSYRKALPAAEAVAELQRCSGTDFDPAVVDALTAVLRKT